MGWVAKILLQDLAEKMELELSLLWKAENVSPRQMGWEDHAEKWGQRYVGQAQRFPGSCQRSTGEIAADRLVAARLVWLG